MDYMSLFCKSKKKPNVHVPVKLPKIHVPVPLMGYKRDCKFYTLHEMQVATDNFNEDYVIGSDGFGKVYYGIIPCSVTNPVVAIKQVNIFSSKEGYHEDKREAFLLLVHPHRNVVHLHGVCQEGDNPFLVYEFTPLGSLDKALYGDNRKTILDWDTRLRIAVGITKGLQFLHERGILHHDLKSANILLGDGYEPKLANFWIRGLNPFVNDTHFRMKSWFTAGYMDPEYAVTRQFTVKSDIYSLGIVLLELLTGRKALDHSRPNGECRVVYWAKPKFEDRSLYQTMVDPELKGRFDAKQLLGAMMIAARCVDSNPRLRPTAAEALEILSRIISCSADECVGAEQEHRPSTAEEVLSDTD